MVQASLVNHIPIKNQLLRLTPSSCFSNKPVITYHTT